MEQCESTNNQKTGRQSTTLLHLGRRGRLALRYKMYVHKEYDDRDVSEGEWVLQRAKSENIGQTHFIVMGAEMCRITPEFMSKYRLQRG